MIKKLTKGSTWLSLLENIIYIFPTLGTVLYYYFSEIQQTVSKSSKLSFAMALCLFVLFLVYKAVMARKIGELRQSVVQTETDLKSMPDSEVEHVRKLAMNAKKDRRTLDLYDRGSIMITLLILALGVSILEKALIGLTTLLYIALGSIMSGYGIHLGVLELRQREAVKPIKRGDKHV